MNVYLKSGDKKTNKISALSCLGNERVLVILVESFRDADLCALKNGQRRCFVYYNLLLYKGKILWNGFNLL